MFRASTGTNCHRRESPWLGRSVQWTSRVRGLERPSLISVVERTRNARDSNGFEGVFQSGTRKEHSSSNRQHFCDGLLNHKGGPSPALSKLAKVIWAEAIQIGVSIKCAHIAGVENQESDFWSRRADKHNWRLHPRLFAYLDLIWGPHTVDRFANCQNTQLPRFNSRYWEPLSEAVDALSQDYWGYENNFVNAPFCLLHKVLDVIQDQRAQATVIAPKWLAQPWYSRLQSMAVAPPLG